MKQEKVLKLSLMASYLRIQINSASKSDYKHLLIFTDYICCTILMMLMVNLQVQEHTYGLITWNG